MIKVLSATTTIKLINRKKRRVYTGRGNKGPGTEARGIGETGRRNCSNRDRSDCYRAPRKRETLRRWIQWKGVVNHRTLNIFIVAYRGEKTKTAGRASGAYMAWSPKRAPGKPKPRGTFWGKRPALFNIKSLFELPPRWIFAIRNFASWFRQSGFDLWCLGNPLGGGQWFFSTLKRLRSLTQQPRLFISHPTQLRLHGVCEITIWIFTGFTVYFCRPDN